jgi:MYXO-CTERM domain-containing protein
MTPKQAERLLVGLVALALVAPTAAGAAAEPRFEESSKRYELENDEISVWFQGKKPLLKVFPTDNESRSYQLHMLRVAEFEDADGDRAYDENESAAFVNLARADQYDVSVRSEADAVHFALNLNTTIQDRGSPDLGDSEPPLPGDEPRANITLRFHVFGSNRTLETATGTTTVEAREAKFDIEVHRWDWRTEDGQLAFVGELPATNGTEARADNGTDRVNVEKNGTAVGYTAWQDAAQVTDENGTRTVDVEPTVREQDNGTVQLAWAYDATGYDALTHDPTTGVTETSTQSSDDGSVGGISDVPGPGAAAALAAVLGAAAARRRGVEP